MYRNMMVPALQRALANLPAIFDSMKEAEPPELDVAQEYHRELVGALHDHIECFRARLEVIETGSQSHYELYSTYAQSAKAKSQRANQIAVHLMKWLQS